MNGLEQNYEIHDKELLTIIQCLGEWWAELEGLQLLDHFDIYSNHQALEYFMTTKKLNAHQVCWAEFLSQFYFSIHYQPGKQNTLTGTLSHPTDGTPINKSHHVQTLLKLAILDSKIGISLSPIASMDPKTNCILTLVTHTNQTTSSLTP